MDALLGQLVLASHSAGCGLVLLLLCMPAKFLCVLHKASLARGCKHCPEVVLPDARPGVQGRRATTGGRVRTGASYAKRRS